MVSGWVFQPLPTPVDPSQRSDLRTRAGGGCQLRRRSFLEEGGRGGWWGPTAAAGTRRHQPCGKGRGKAVYDGRSQRGQGSEDPNSFLGVAEGEGAGIRTRGCVGSRPGTFRLRRLPWVGRGGRGGGAGAGAGGWVWFGRQRGHRRVRWCEGLLQPHTPQRSRGIQGMWLTQIINFFLQVPAWARICVGVAVAASGCGFLPWRCDLNPQV